MSIKSEIIQLRKQMTRLMNEAASDTTAKTARRIDALFEKIYAILDSIPNPFKIKASVINLDQYLNSHIYIDTSDSYDVLEAKKITYIQKLMTIRVTDTSTLELAESILHFIKKTTEDSSTIKIVMKLVPQNVKNILDTMLVNVPLFLTEEIKQYQLKLLEPASLSASVIVTPNVAEPKSDAISDMAIALSAASTTTDYDELAAIQQAIQAKQAHITMNAALVFNSTQLQQSIDELTAEIEILSNAEDEDALKKAIKQLNGYILAQTSVQELAQEEKQAHELKIANINQQSILHYQSRIDAINTDLKRCDSLPENTTKEEKLAIYNSTIQDTQEQVSHIKNDAEKFKQKQLASQCDPITLSLLDGQINSIECSLATTLDNKKVLEASISKEKEAQEKIQREHDLQKQAVKQLATGYVQTFNLYLAKRNLKYIILDTLAMVAHLLLGCFGYKRITDKLSREKFIKNDLIPKLEQLANDGSATSKQQVHATLVNGSTLFAPRSLYQESLRCKLEEAKENLNSVKHKH